MATQKIVRNAKTGRFSKTKKAKTAPATFSMAIYNICYFILLFRPANTPAPCNHFPFVFIHRDI